MVITILIMIYVRDDFVDLLSFFDLESGDNFIIVDKEIRRAPISWPHDIDIYVDRIFRRSIEAVKAARQVYHSSKSIIEETMA